MEMRSFLIFISEYFSLYILQNHFLNHINVTFVMDIKLYLSLQKGQEHILPSTRLLSIHLLEMSQF